jgi:Flp pilus assembly protein CpaB
MYRLSGWPRRLLALGCLLLAAATALGGHNSAGASGPARPVVVAAHDLAAGRVLTSADLTVASWAVAQRPASAIATAPSVIGRRLAGPVDSGEPITGTRLVGAELTSGLPTGLVAASVPLADTAALGLIHPGDSIDLFAAGDATADVSATTLARDIRVLAVLPPSSDGGAGSLVIAVDRVTATNIATANGRAFLAAVRGSP